MKEITGIRPKLASQILEFFKRHKSQAELDDALPILESLQNKLLEGHSSLNLTEIGKEIEILKANDLVGGPQEMRPLVLASSGDLYFKRYFDYEISIAKKIREWSNISKQHSNTAFNTSVGDLSKNFITQLLKSPSSCPRRSLLILRKHL